MLEDVRTRVLTHSDKGLPSLTGDYQELNPLLEKILVEGFNIQYPNSAAIDQNFILTLTYPSEHFYTNNSVICFENITQSEYQRNFRVRSVTSTSLTILLDETFTEPPALSTDVFTKVAPLGYSIKFKRGTSTVYTSPHWDGCLKIDDGMHPEWNSSYTVFARVQLALDYTDLETPVHPYYPTSLEITKNSSGVPSGSFVRIYLNTSTNGAAETSKSALSERRWYLFGDDKGFYFFNTPNSTSSNSNLFYNYFGTVLPLNKNTPFLTERSLFCLASYKSTIATTALTFSTANSFLATYDTGGRIANGFFLGPYTHETWISFYGNPLNLSQKYSGGSYTKVPYENSYVLDDYTLPTYVHIITNNASEAIAEVRGMRWCATDYEDSSRSEYNYQRYTMTRKDNSCINLFAMERKAAYVSFDVISDWD